MPRSKGKHGRRRVMVSDDPDALEIDIDRLPTVKGTLLHFHELRPGDLFSTELWYDAGFDAGCQHGVTIDALIYLGLGHYTTMGATAGGFTDPESGALVTLLSRMPSGTVEEDSV